MFQDGHSNQSGGRYDVCENGNRKIAPGLMLTPFAERETVTRNSLTLLFYETVTC